MSGPLHRQVAANRGGTITHVGVGSVAQGLVDHMKASADRFIETADNEDLAEVYECLHNLAAAVGIPMAHLRYLAELKADQQGPLVTSTDNRPSIWVSLP